MDPDTSSVSHVDELLSFYQKDSKFWKTVALRLHAALASLQEEFNIAVPPEPPMGTRYVIDEETIWRRSVGGWYCSRRDCRNCPCEWGEAYERISPQASRVIVHPRTFSPED